VECTLELAGIEKGSPIPNGLLKARLQKTGTVVSDNDLWIAACAKRAQSRWSPTIENHFEKIPDLQLITLAPEKASQKSGRLFEP
jgi:predicted nucleic acid-binding protein